MKAPLYVLDTSFVIRLLTRSPLPAFRSAAGFLDRWTPEQPALRLPDLALAEAYYALQHHYHYPKADALAALHALAGHPAIAATPEATAVLSLPGLASAKPGFVDLLIHASARSAAASLVTFEKSARKLPETIVLEG